MDLIRANVPAYMQLGQNCEIDQVHIQLARVATIVPQSNFKQQFSKSLGHSFEIPINFGTSVEGKVLSVCTFLEK